MSRDANQDWLIIGTNQNPIASIQIQVGKTIEVLFSGDGKGSNGAFIRQGPTPDIPAATSTTLGTSVHGSDFFRRVTVAYDPAKPYMGILKGGVSGTERTLRMYSHTRWRVLP